jgi:RHS repeat-associated protein
MFSSPYKITHETKDVIDLSYNITEQRSIMYWGSTNTDKNLRPFRRYYSADGSMEVTVKFTNNNYVTPNSVEIITFVDGTAYDSEIVVKNTYIGSATTATGGLFYLHRDYQGSIIAITNSVGAVIEKRQYDPWGLLTKIQDGTGNNLTKLTFFDRGYTGHEHLESVGLINMNGRVYDPILHRFLQADSMVQEPYNTQNYNRYGYCLNNPLKYTDISGEDFGVTLAISLGVALVMYFGDAIINDKPITFKGIATTVVITAVSGGIAYGIGSVAAGIGNFYTRATFQALAHGLTQGGMTALSGGKFWSGFAAGCIASIMSSAWQGGEHITDNGNQTMSRTHLNGIGGAGANSTVGTMFVGTISGGAGAALTKGNFWQGAVTGLIVSGLNHSAHLALDGGGDPKPKLKQIPKDLQAKIDRLRAGFEFLEDYGGYAEIGGLILAPFTEGASLGVVGVGMAFTAVGTTGNTILDLYEYKYTNNQAKLISARNRVIKYGLTLGTGKALDKLTFNFTDKLITKFLDVVIDKGIYTSALPTTKSK